MTNIIKTVSRILVILLIMQIIFAVGSVSRVKALSDIISEGRDFIKDRKRSTRYRRRKRSNSRYVSNEKCNK